VVVRGAMAGLAGEIAIDIRVAGGPDVIPSSPPLHDASRVANKKITITKLDPCFMIFSLIRTTGFEKKNSKRSALVP
jgi:hypothetical protein